jgi:hypothetical protein
LTPTWTKVEKLLKSYGAEVYEGNALVIRALEHELEEVG